MIGIVVRVIVNAIALWITTLIVPDITFGSDASVAGVIGVAIVFGLVNTYIRPILKLLTLPLSIMSLGLFGLVINGILLLIVAAVSDAFGLHFSVDGFPPEFGLSAVLWAIVGSIVLSIVSTVLSMLSPSGGLKG